MSLPPGYPSHYESRIILKNGSEVFLRPVLPSDGSLLIDLFNRCSPQTRYLRFLSHIPELSEDMLFHFTNVNYVTEFALVALIKEEENDSIIAVGRYSQDTKEHPADLAVAVRDDWQHLGLGKQILTKVISIGKDNGICRFGSMMEAQNDIVKRILSDLGHEVSYSFRDGAFQVEISIEENVRVTSS